MSSSVLAIVTTIHVSMFVMRQHRSRPAGAQAFMLVPAAVFSVLVWLVPDRTWILSGLAAHLAWFAFSEFAFRPTLAPAPAARLAPSLSPSLSAPRARSAQVTGSREPRTVPVLAVFDETPDIKTFRIVRPDGFEFRAGQFLTIRAQVDGKPVQRAYSISSAPHARGYLEISVKRIGLVSSVLHSSLRPGAIVTVRPPAGSFTYPTGDDRPLVLLAGGIGITPLISMLRYAVAAEPARPVSLLYSIRAAEDFAFGDELAVIGRRNPQVRIGIAVTQGPPSDRWHRGRISGAMVRAYSPDLAHSLAYICGPQPMIDAMKTLLAELGVPSSQVRTESFGAAMQLVTSEVDPAARPGSSAPAIEIAEPLSEPVVVRFARTGCEASVRPGETLLEAAEAHGVDIPSVCRAGSCHTCRTRLMNGDVCCESDTLSDEDRAEGFILPCVSRPRGDCELEA